MTIERGTVSGNTAGYGGGLLNEATTDAHGTTFTGNSTERRGGGVTQFGGDLTIDGATVSKNTAPDQGGGIFNGVGGPVSGTFSISDSAVSENYAPFGGGIANGGVLTMQGGSVTANTATYGAGFVNIAQCLCPTTITGTVFDANVAQQDGGGVAALGGDLTLVDVTASNNKANRGGGIFGGAGGQVTGSLTIEEGSVTGNSAPLGGGLLNEATTAVHATTFSGNSSVLGGGIMAFSGDLALDAITVSGNSAQNSSPP